MQKISLKVDNRCKRMYLQPPGLSGEKQSETPHQGKGG